MKFKAVPLAGRAFFPKIYRKLKHRPLRQSCAILLEVQQMKASSNKVAEQ